MMLNLSHMGLSTITREILVSETGSESDAQSDGVGVGGGGEGDLDGVSGLDLSHNQIVDFDFLAHVASSLETLILDHNQIHSHVRLPTLPNLHTLWANHNQISNLPIFISTLSVACPRIRHLSLMNNACAPSYLNGGSVKAYRDYRQFVISKMPTLENLDDRVVTKLERADAEKAYGALEL